MNTSEQNGQKPKRKLFSLAISDKLKVIEKIEAGVSGARISRMFGISQGTVSDIKRQKMAIKAYATHFGITKTDTIATKKKITKMRSKEFRFENLLYTWYAKQRRNDISVVLEIFLEAAENLKQKMGYTNLVCNEEWLAQYKERYSIIIDDRKITDTAEVVEKSQLQESVCSSFEHDYDYDESGVRDETMEAFDMIIKEEEELQEWLNQTEMSEGNEKTEDLQEIEFSSEQKSALEAARKGIDDVIKLVGYTVNRGLWAQYETLRIVRELLIEDEKILTATQKIKLEECLSPN